MRVEGIRNITPTDIAYAHSLGYKIKLLAKVERDLTSGDLSVAVHPTLIPHSNTISNVDGVYNGISLVGGRCRYYCVDWAWSGTGCYG